MKHNKRLCFWKRYDTMSSDLLIFHDLKPNLESTLLSRKKWHRCNGNKPEQTEREKELLLVDLQILQSWCHDYPGNGTKIYEREKDGTYFQLLFFPQSGAARDPGHSTKNMRGKKDGTLL